MVNATEAGPALVVPLPVLPPVTADATGGNAALPPPPHATGTTARRQSESRNAYEREPIVKPPQVIALSARLALHYDEAGTPSIGDHAAPPGELAGMTGGVAFLSFFAGISPAISAQGRAVYEASRST
jgi:hypothetical protein